MDPVPSAVAVVPKLEVAVVSNDVRGNPVQGFSAKTIKEQLKASNPTLTGKDLQQRVRDILRESTGSAIDRLNGHVRKGMILQSVRESTLKSGQSKAVYAFVTPKVSEIETLRADLAKALKANEEMAKQLPAPKKA